MQNSCSKCSNRRTCSSNCLQNNSQIFAVDEDFDLTWMDQRHTSSGSLSKASSNVTGPGKNIMQFGIMTLIEAHETNF